MSIRTSLENAMISHGNLDKNVHIGIAMKLWDLEDENITKNYKMSDWEEILKMSSKNQEFIAAIFKAKNVPYEIYEKIFDDNMISPEQLYGAIRCNDIPIGLIGKLKESQTTMFWADYLADVDDLLDASDVLINCLCESTFTELEEMGYKPFEVVKDDYMTNLIEDTICKPNFSMFPSDTPESFTNAVTNNIYLTDEVRNKAFDMGFIPYQMYNFTKYTAEEYYKFFADNMFEIFPTTKSEKRLHSSAAVHIMQMMANGNLSEACQEDFIQRFQNANIEVDDRPYKTILQYTKSPNILLSACGFKMKDYKHLIAGNPNLSEFVKEELFVYFPAEEQKTILLRMLGNEKLTEKGLKELVYWGDINLNRAVMIHPKTPESIREELINNEIHTMRYGENYSSQFKMLNEISKSLDVIKNPEVREKVMYNILKTIMNQDEIRNSKDIFGQNCTSHEEVFETLGVNTKHNLRKLSDEHFVAISDKLNDLQKTFPSQKDILELCVKELENINKKSRLYYQFPELYIDHYKETHEGNKIEFNFNNLYHISKEKLKRLYDFVKEETNSDILEKLQEDIKFGLIGLPICDCDIVYKSVAKFTMLYGIINDRLEDLERTPICEEIER